jgi:hypothetical protein
MKNRGANPVLTIDNLRIKESKERKEREKEKKRRGVETA